MLSLQTFRWFILTCSDVLVHLSKWRWITWSFGWFLAHLQLPGTYHSTGMSRGYPPTKKVLQFCSGFMATSAALCLCCLQWSQGVSDLWCAVVGEQLLTLQQRGEKGQVFCQSDTKQGSSHVLDPVNHQALSPAEDFSVVWQVGNFFCFVLF